MGYATILGLDLGKFKSVCCLMDAAPGSHRFETLATTPEALHQLLAPHAPGTTTTATTATTAAPVARALLVIETCDVAGWVHDLAVALGVAVTVVHPRATSAGGGA